MSWILLSVMSAVVLGLYDLLKKMAVKENAVPPVLFFGVVTGAGCWLLLRLLTPLLPMTWQNGLSIDALTAAEHGFLFGKGVLVSGSWIFGYFALKHLPMTIAGPIRSTAPIWTILFAVLLMGEMPTPWQWGGVCLILAAFYAFSLLGKAEGIVFHRDKWVFFLLVATVLGAFSALYDKFLLQTLGIRVATLQFWFSVYLVAVMLPFVLIWRYGMRVRTPFEWRWMIPAVGVGLLIADAFYFLAIAQDDALISVISPIRRTSVIIGFIGGVWILRERHSVAKKGFALALMLAGVILLNWKGQ
ncbi:MAG: EamA family transporter [Verrucomicrobiales bacterium]|nr:EamA family transporter [Verrucomicrobiales bacterium]